MRQVSSLIVSLNCLELVATNGVFLVPLILMENGSKEVMINLITHRNKAICM